MIDHSDDLSRLSALVSLLTESAPNGRWKDEPLFIKWRKSRYSLSLGEFVNLTIFLEREWRQIVEARKYVQLDLLGGANEQNL
ncbi:hypothetical protein C7B65_15110 [Phormidesmis priestleyi ULC007]|uniref:Uncharacterized protein n=1 Tax=Phormidesmis priestleyi ULC007 TaxID=1920490 RepID=A0A2T1DDA9_9CYAN|nr:hypothetical protein [Phormidesmis priestleyi]PSB18421.1 hypothetical protein C7B65_15110 [Phormidesmis priestleyi ULC007]PZO48852.1 MAG: hypothetical protein DCF14_16080 [Phormidesmis priestleyi]